MNIEDLVKIFRGLKEEDAEYNIAVINKVINTIANYVMYEQTIVKKDSINENESVVTYKYDKKSYEAICMFLSNIDFIEPPIIGSNKKVEIKDLPNELQSTIEDLKEKIYILDKVKDSFMHLNGNMTMFAIDPIREVIIIKNCSSTYSLECKIPNSALKDFNTIIRKYYFNVNPDFKWIAKAYHQTKETDDYRYSLIKNTRFRMMKVEGRRKVIFQPGTLNYLFMEKDYDEKKSELSSANLSLSELLTYHTYSYLTLLNASRDEKNYPLLKNIYNGDFYCNHPAYISKMESIIKKCVRFYENICKCKDYITDAVVKEKIFNFLHHIAQNGEEDGLLVDMSEINNLIIKKYLRNARAHANNKSEENSKAVDETIKYYDVACNSEDNSRVTPVTFFLIARRTQFNELFDEVNNSSESTSDFYNRLSDDVENAEFAILDDILEQLESMIKHSKLAGIGEPDKLLEENKYANNFIEFIRENLGASVIRGTSTKHVKVIKV